MYRKKLLKKNNPTRLIFLDKLARRVRSGVSAACASVERRRWPLAAMVVGCWLVSVGCGQPLLANTISSYSLADYQSLTKFMNDMALEKSMPAYQVNTIKGDISFSRGNYFEAQKYYKRSINDPALRDSLNRLLKLEFKLLLCFDRMEDFSLVNHALEDFKISARKVDDAECLAAIPYFKGKVEYYVGNKELGFKLIREAIAETKKTDEPTKNDNLLFFYNNLVKLLQKNSMSQEAYTTLGEMKQLVQDIHHSPSTSIAFSDEMWMKEFYGLNTITLQRLGRQEEATAYFDKFLAMTHVQIYDYSCIESYLFEKGLYADIIRFGKLRLNYLTSVNDTLNSCIPAVYRLLAKAYAHMGLYNEALHNYQLLDEATLVQMQMGELSAMDELSANYSAHLAEMTKQQNRHRMFIINLLVGIGIVGLLVALYLVRTVRYNRTIKRKNISLVRTIDELMEAKKMTASIAPPKDEPQADDSPADEAGPAETTPPAGASAPDAQLSIAEYQEQLKFKRMNHDILEKKLYLNPELSRMMLLEKYNIPRNNFSSLFQKYVGTSYSKYINNLRLEEAAKMLKEQPNYTIESVANDCGISSVATLYRLFSKKYGMTPTEYRQTIMLSRQLSDDEI